MNTIYTSDKAALTLFGRAFPGTGFRTIRLNAFKGPMNLNSYWDSGYRDFYAIVRISDGAPLRQVEQNGTPFDGRNYELSELPEGYAVAVHSMAGQRSSGALYMNAANITPMLPSPATEMPWIEKAVLAIVCGLKSFARREEAKRMGISEMEFDATLETLKGKALISRMGGITNDGRNLVSTFKLGCGFDAIALEGGRDCDYSRTAARMATYANS